MLKPLHISIGYEHLKLHLKLYEYVGVKIVCSNTFHAVKEQECFIISDAGSYL